MTELLFILFPVSVVLGAITGGRRWVTLKHLRREFRGLKFKVLGYHDGQFEVAGFRPEFLEALRTIQDVQHRPS